MNRWGLYLTVVAVTLFAIGVGGLNLLYRLQVRPGLETQIAKQARYQNLYEDDQTYLAKSATELTLGASGGSSDAGPFLNSRVLWTPAPAKRAQTALVDQETRIALLRTGNDWILQIPKGRFPKPDLGVFNELSKYDYWDIERESPLEDLSLKHEFVPPPQLPIPDTSDLLSAVKLRLIKGGLENDYVQALRNTREMARLMLTTENIQLVLAGLLALDFERRAYRYFVDELKMDPKLWTPIDSNITRRARRAVVATRSYLRLWTPPEVLEKYFLGSTVAPGICAAVNEAIPFDYSLRKVLEPHWPFEMDTRAEYARLDRIVLKAKTECRLRYLTAILEFGRIRVPIPGPFLFLDLPYSRKIFGLRLSTADLGGYEEYGKQAGPQTEATSAN